MPCSPRCRNDVVTRENPGPRREAGLKDSALGRPRIPRSLREFRATRGEKMRIGRLSQDMPNKSAPDRVLAELARRQHGTISSQQLRETGLTRTAVLERCQSGRLHRLHRGVYAVGHTAPNNERRWMAAVLALGNGAALSHRSAAALWNYCHPGKVLSTSPSRPEMDGVADGTFASTGLNHLSRKRLSDTVRSPSPHLLAPSRTSRAQSHPRRYVGPPGKPISSGCQSAPMST